MPFQTRNPFYLRISEKNVLPLYLYLDEHHVNWMSDIVLQHVLADLRPHILPKLQTEAGLVEGGASSSKKGTVDTHRGETYQFCYFFRKAEPHSVVIKARNFIAVSSQKQLADMPPPAQLPSKSRQKKRKSKFGGNASINEGIRKKRKTKKARERDSDDGGSSASTDAEGLFPSNQWAPRRSSRPINVPTRAYQESGGVDDDLTCGESVEQVVTAEMVNQVIDEEEFPPSNDTEVDIPPGQKQPSQSMQLELEDEEEKPKPVLQLKYQGFNIFGLCLCIVVEPWPPVRSVSKARFATPALARAPATVPRNTSHMPGHRPREQTPLFLPDDYERNEPSTSIHGVDMDLESLLLNPSFLEDSEDSGDEGGMMLFSQVLNNTGAARAGAADDDEDMDTDMFFGDADEMRELR